MLMLAALVLALMQASATAAAASAAGSKPHIVSILQDDLGYYDTGIHNPEAAAWTANITSLAKEGIVLTNHYTHWHCSPTRRSFLTGRWPIHHGEQLSADDTDDIDLRMNWVSDKLHAAGYQGHWFGKWHTGFKSMHHLGFEHGFNGSTIGSFQTGGAYSGPHHTMRWENDHPIWNDAQFTNMPGADANRGGLACNQTGGGPDEDDGGVTAAAGPACNSSMLENMEMQCGTRITYAPAASAAACCAVCTDTPGCTHWVHNPSGDAEKACHVKAGKTCPGSHQQGTTSGVVGHVGPPGPPPAPGPAPAPGPPATCTNEYSTDLWGRLALQAVEQHPLPTPLYVHLCFEAVHTPYDQAPGDPTSSVYRGLVWRADVYIGEIVAALKAREMWDTTLIVYSADNGGVGSGINYPLRGEKHSNWEGGLRTAAFVSGGLIPTALRGSSNGVNMHIRAKDDPPTPPLPGDHAHPFRNIYGDHSYPPLDGVDLWPMLTEPSTHATDSAHKHLVLSKEVLVAANYKLLVAQPYFKSQNNGWKDQNGTWSTDNGGLPPADCTAQTLAPSESFFAVPHNASLRPCLFDLRKDPSERHNVAGEFPEIVEELWAALNQTILTQRDCNGWSYKGVPGGQIPGPLDPSTNTTGCSPPERLGNCDTECAQNHWKSGYGNQDGPICDVPGCGGK